MISGTYKYQRNPFNSVENELQMARTVKMSPAVKAKHIAEVNELIKLLKSLGLYEELVLILEYIVPKKYWYIKDWAAIRKARKICKPL